MDWILHIGTQKTGSKAIQNFFVDNPNLLADKNILFPKAGRIGVWHKPIYNELIAGKTQKLSAAIQEGKDSAADFGIISSEALYALNLDQIELLYSVLGSAKIILYIRRQDQLANSFLNQLVKAHRVNYESICDFEAKLLKYNPNYDHLATIKRRSRVFGAENVIPIIFNKNTSVIETFFFHLGMKDVVYSGGHPEKNPNPALNYEAFKILKEVKRLNKNDEDLPHLVTIAHRELKNGFVDTYNQGDQYLLSRFQREVIYQKYHRSNSELQEAYFRGKAMFPELEASEASEASALNKSINMDIVRKIYHEAGISCKTDK